MWESFFGFKKTPFSDRPDAKQLFSSAAARVFTATLNPNLHKILYIHFSSGTALDLLRQIADAVVRLDQSKKQHPILICDEAHPLPHPALEQLPLLLNFDMDSSRYLTLLLIGQPLLRRTLSLQLHEALRQRIGTHYRLEGLTREELDAYLTQQLKAAGVTQPLFEDTARQGLYQATKGIPRKVNKLAVTALRLAAERKAPIVDDALLLDATSEAFL
jgi:type II secretory pathway predicted ATPase ExeA